VILTEVVQASPGDPDDREAASRDMVVPRSKTGQHAGREFWGCSMYAKTKCGGIHDVK